MIIYVGPGQNDPKFHLRQKTVKCCYQLNIFVKHLLNLGILHPRRSVRDTAESAQRKCQWKCLKLLFAQHSVTII